MEASGDYIAFASRDEATAYVARTEDIRPNRPFFGAYRMASDRSGDILLMRPDPVLDAELNVIVDQLWDHYREIG